MTLSCDGYAVQVPVPRAVAEWARGNRRHVLNRDWRPDESDYSVAERWADALRGLRVSMLTTVKRSDRDSSFGFGRGTSSVQITPPEAEPEAQ